MIGLSWLITACGDDGVEVIPIAAVPTVLPTPSEVVLLPPTQRPPTRVWTSTPQPTHTLTAQPTQQETDTPVPLAMLVIAVKPIPAGAPIPPEAVQVVRWPLETLPYRPITEPDRVINEVALVDIGCHEPIIPETIAYREIGTGFDPLPGTCPPLRADAPIEKETIDVVIAVEDLPAGSIIEPGTVTLRPWPLGALPPGYHRSLSEVIGTTVTSEVRREQPITAQRVTSD